MPENYQPRLPETILPLLETVDRPGRYVGGEMNAQIKAPATLRASIALAFPDVYDLGMSYHGFRLLYERVNQEPDFAAERVYCPWPDFAKALREKSQPLYTLETYRPLAQMDLIGFTLQHELCATNVLEMLDLARIPLRARDRADSHPLVIGGGEGAYAPEPLAPFFDAFLLGDGEDGVLRLLETAARAKEEHWAKTTLLEELARIEGVYVPSLYEPLYQDDRFIGMQRLSTAAPETIKPALHSLSAEALPLRPVVPLIRTVQDRTVVEIRRGCVHGCRFCHAGMVSRPIRERPVKQIQKIVRSCLENTGDQAVSLLSLSSADYTQIQPLAEALSDEWSEAGVSLSLPSLRISSFDVALATQVSSVRKSGFTFAPEAGSERLRRVINKPLDEAAFLDVVEQVLDAGWRTLKFYFMIGLPTETESDLDGIVQIVTRAQEITRRKAGKKAQINLTLSPFVPKPHTPFQWEAQATREAIAEKIHYIRDRLPRKGVAVKTSPLEASVLEATLARGDRRQADWIEKAFQKGCRFDAWSEHFQPHLWREAAAETHIDIACYAHRQRNYQEALPWDHLKAPPGRAFLEKERDRARAEDTTPDCVRNPCAGCDACPTPKAHQLAENTTLTQHAEKAPRQLSTKPPVQRLRLTFSKTDSLRFVSHLDLAETIHRQIRRSDAPVAHSQGFNPQPRIALSPPLPLGFEALGETADILLLQRIEPQKWLQQLRSLSAPRGLTWTAIHEVPLKAPSVQQALETLEYHLSWRPLSPNATTTLPLQRTPTEEKIQKLLTSKSWPIQIQRKGKPQTRDLRHYIVAAATQEPQEGESIAMTLAIRSENGATLSPLIILEALFGSEPTQGVLFRAIRQPLTINN